MNYAGVDKIDSQKRFLAFPHPIIIMSVVSLISWLKNPYEGKRAEVRVNTLRARDIVLMCVFSAIVTVIFYFILAAFGTENLVPSTLSVTTSFVAVYLTFKRSPYFALAYACNDVVLILLWTLAGMTDTKYIPVMICFVSFLANDIYGFLCWQKMKKRQRK